MTKRECFLILLCVIFFGFGVWLLCVSYQYRQNVSKEFAKLQKEILLIQEKNDKQDSLIASVIRTQAMSGMFDIK